MSSTPVRPYRGVSAEERRAVRKAALLEAALDLMGSPGSKPVTMTAVCERAGLTERYFYESFRDRDSLLLELLDTIATEILDAALGAFEHGEGTGEDRARQALAAFVHILTEDPRKGRVAIIEAVGIPALRARRQELFAGFERLALERSRQIYGNEAWGAPDDQIASLFFVGGMAEVVARWLNGDVEATPEQIIEAATRHFLAGAHR